MRIIRGNVAIILIVTLSAVSYSTLSLLQHWRFESHALDLGLFDQAIWCYSRLTPARSTVRGFPNLLGDHFHPILMTLAPLYWINPKAETLLIAQAVLLSLGAVPVYLFAKKRLGTAPGLIFALSYCLYWGIQEAASFDFHEIAFAVPLIACALYFADGERWPLYFTCVLLLLLTKENLSVFVAACGLYLIVTGRFKQGAISIAVGVSWLFLATKVFIPYFAGQPYIYWDYSAFGTGPVSSLKTIVRRPWLVAQVMFSEREKIRTIYYLLHPFTPLVICSPLIITSAPLLAERFLADQPNFWWTEFHYSATIAPVVAMASADGLARLISLVKNDGRASRVALIVSLAVLALNVRLVPPFALGKLLYPQYWRLSADYQTGREALALIPPHASVVAQSAIVPHLSGRREIYSLGYLEWVKSGRTPECEFVVVGGPNVDHWPVDYEAVRSYLAAQKAKGYRPIYERGEWVVLKRQKSRE